MFTSDPLTIYLQDHYGGASFGAELARRARGENAPLSPVLELEGLISGVRGKLALWRALRGIAPGEPRLDAAELDRLAARAELQLEALQEQHDRLTREVLTPSR